MSRPCLLSYNTVERLLLGDFFHAVTWDEVRAALSAFPPDWPLRGIGTTNWFRRNGETIVRGTAGAPELIWSDPEGASPMATVDLLHNRPDPAGPRLVSPSLADPDDRPAFPFLALGVCDPATRLTWHCGAHDHLHQWITAKLEEANIGLAAVEVHAGQVRARYASAFYLPLEGLQLHDGYNASANLKLADMTQGSWVAGGIYAANPTVQRVISVPGLPLHLHGQETTTGLGGHVIQLGVGSAEVSVWPLKDLKLEILNLDQTWMPIRNLSLHSD